MPEIESEVKRKELSRIIRNWCKCINATSLLMSWDILDLVQQILEEFYPIHLRCGHWVKDIDENILVQWQENKYTECAIYCPTCAKQLEEEGRGKCCSM